MAIFTVLAPSISKIRLEFQFQWVPTNSTDSRIKINVGHHSGAGDQLNGKNREWPGKISRSPWARASDALDHRSEGKFHTRRVARLVRRIDFAVSQEPFALPNQGLKHGRLPRRYLTPKRHLART
jgi:hypothetical protein